MGVDVGTGRILDKLDFQRLAPRYVDGETTEGEARSLQSILLTDTAAQRHIELLEVENSVMGRAFRRPPEDISVIVIRVRRRNPYRKLYVSPALALALQILLIAGIGALLVKLASELAPPSILVDDRVGKTITLDNEPLADQSIPLQQQLLCGAGSQIRFKIGSADTLRLNQNGNVAFANPEPGAHHVVELTSGEVWARFIDPQAGFKIHLLPALPGVTVAGERAEFNLVAGASACTPLLPRGYTPDALPVLLIRVMEGKVSVSAGGASHDIGQGKAGVLLEGGRFEFVNDPDFAYYPSLRMDGSQRFKQSWDWCNPRTYPLAREIITYELWKPLIERAILLMDERNRATSRDGPKEIADYIERISTYLLKAKHNLDALPPEQKATDKRALLETPPETVAQLAGTLHEKEGNIPLLMMLEPEISALIDGWKRRAPEYLPLASSGDLTGVLKVLANMDDGIAETLARAYGIRKTREKIEKDLLTARNTLTTARTELTNALNNPGRVAPGGNGLAMLQGNLDKLNQDIKGFTGIDEQIALKQLRLRPIEQGIENIEAEIRPRDERRAALEAELQSIAAELGANTYDQNTLKQAEAAIEQWSQKLTPAITDRDSLAAALSTKREQIKGVEGRLGERVKVLESMAAKRNELDAALLAQVAKAGELRRKERDARANLARAELALSLVPSGRRAGSPEQAALEAAQQTLAEISAAVTAASAEMEPLLAQVSNYGKEVAVVEGEIAAIEAELSGHQGEAAATEGRLKNAQTLVDQAKAEIDKAAKERDIQQTQKKQREELGARRAAIEQTQLPPLESELNGLRQRLEAETALAAPFRAELKDLQNKQDQCRKLVEERESLERQIDQIFALEEQVRTCRQTVIERQNSVLQAYEKLVDKYNQLAALLTRSSPPMNPSIVTMRQQRAESASQLAQLDLTDDVRDSITENAIQLGDSLAQEYEALVLSREETSILLLDNLRSRWLATAYLKAIAAAGESALLEDNELRVRVFTGLRDATGGFGKPAGDPGAKEASVYSILRAHVPNNMPVPGVRDGDAASEGQRKDWDSKVDLLLAKQWKLFYWADAMSERERREAPDAGKPVTQKCYAPTILNDSNDPRLREFNVEWRDEFKRTLSTEEQRDLEKFRLHP